MSSNEVFDTPELAEALLLQMGPMGIIAAMGAAKALRFAVFGLQKLRQAVMLEVKEMKRGRYQNPDEYDALSLRTKVHPLFRRLPLPPVAASSTARDPLSNWSVCLPNPDDPIAFPRCEVIIQQLCVGYRLLVDLKVTNPYLRYSAKEVFDEAVQLPEPLLYNTYLTDPSLPLEFTVCWAFKYTDSDDDEQSQPTRGDTKMPDALSAAETAAVGAGIGRFSIVSSSTSPKIAEAKARMKLRTGAKINDLVRIAQVLISLVPESALPAMKRQQDGGNPASLGDLELDLGLSELYRRGSRSWKAELVD